jgi:hypothetical protein
MQNETEIALANLDWLIVHEDMKLDYSARAVLNADGQPHYLLSDLTIIGLTPASAQWEGRLSLEICTEAASSSAEGYSRGGPPAQVMRKPHFHRTEGTIEQPEHDWQVRSPALPPEER